MKEMEITFSAETIREMISPCTPQSVVENRGKKGVWSNVWVKLQMK
jgi:hypothetical protein